MQIAKCRPQLENNQRQSNRATQIAWAWVRENGDTKGSHVHILLHVPPNINTDEKRGQRPADNTAGKRLGGLGNKQLRWLRLITGNPYCPGTIRTERIGGTVSAAVKAPAVYRANLAYVVGYINKGAFPAAVRSLSLDRVEAGGNIIGKRAATSQNIGPAARSLKAAN